MGGGHGMSDSLPDLWRSVSVEKEPRHRCRGATPKCFLRSDSRGLSHDDADDMA